MSKSCILVVDDEPMMTEIIQMLLPLYIDVEVVTTNFPQEAFEILCNRSISLLITDYFMPGMNGLELIKRIRERQLALPIIVLTGYYDNPELHQRNDTVGAFEIVKKPWDNTNLVDRIKALLPVA